MVAYPVTGAHVNPAITLGIYLKGNGKYKKNCPMFLNILVAEFAGAFAGAALFLWLTEDTGVELFKVHLYPRPGYSVVKVIFIELVCTMFYVFSICMNKFPNTNRFLSSDSMLKVLYGFIILAVCLYSSNPISGACLNPAIGVSQVFIASQKLGDENGAQSQYYWLYIVP
jgi:glycerol uptake facilitator-like aquaporin